MEVSGPGVESELQLRPTPQSRQHWIWATSVAIAAACGNNGSLTHWVRPEIEPASSRKQNWMRDLLSHSGNCRLSLPSRLNTVSSRYYHYPHFTGKEAEAKRSSNLLSLTQQVRPCGSGPPVLFIYLLLFRATPMAYGGSQARGRVGATATGLCHNLRNAGS